MVLIIIHVANVVSEIFCLMRTTVQLSGVISRYSIRSKVPRSYIGRWLSRCCAQVSNSGLGWSPNIPFVIAQLREDNLTLYYELLCHSGRTVAHSCNIVKTSLLLEAPIEVKILVYWHCAALIASVLPKNVRNHKNVLFMWSFFSSSEVMCVNQLRCWKLWA